MFVVLVRFFLLLSYNCCLVFLILTIRLRYDVNLFWHFCLSMFLSFVLRAFLDIIKTLTNACLMRCWSREKREEKLMISSGLEWWQLRLKGGAIEGGKGGRGCTKRSGLGLNRRGVLV